MARDTAEDVKLEDLTDAEIERIEGAIFCAGGPPAALGAALVARATGAAARGPGPQRR